MQESEQQPLVIWGASGHALVVADIVRLQEQYYIVGFLDDVRPNLHGTEFFGSTIFGGREQLRQLLGQGVKHILLAFGNCKMRLELTPQLQSQGFYLPVAIHPRSIVARDAELGAGTVIAAGAVVNPAVQIGQSVIVNTSASIDHECVIGDAVHVGPGARLAGRVVVGEAAQIGIGATIIDRVRIGSGAIIGAGAVVVRDIPDHVIAYGVPASVKKATEQ